MRKPLFVCMLFFCCLWLFLPRLQAQTLPRCIVQYPTQQPHLLRQSVLPLATLPVQQGEQLQVVVYAQYVKKPLLPLVGKTLLAFGTATAVQHWQRSEQISKEYPARTLATPVPYAVATALLAPAWLRQLRGVPDAYLQVLHYDAQHRYVSGQLTPLTREAKNNWQALSLTSYAPANGYVQIQVVNQSQTEVYVDNWQWEMQSVASHPLSSVRMQADSVQITPIDSIRILRDPIVPIDGGELPPVTIYPRGPIVPTLPYIPIVTNPGGGSTPGLGGPGSGGGGPSLGGGGGGSGGGATDIPIFPPNPRPKQKYVWKKRTGEEVTYEYQCNASNTSCVWAILEVALPEAVVKGNRTLYQWLSVTPVHGQWAISPDGYMYIYDSVFKRWVAPPYNPYKQVRVVRDLCAGYKEMLRIQTAEGKEVIGWITESGQVFIVPLSGVFNGQPFTNTATASTTLNVIQDANGKTVVVVRQATGQEAPDQYGLQVAGLWYLEYLTYDSQGNNTGYERHQIKGHLHTHPSDAQQDTPSNHADIPFARDAKWNGVPKYILNDKNLVQYDANGIVRKYSYTEGCK